MLRKMLVGVGLAAVLGTTALAAPADVYGDLAGITSEEALERRQEEQKSFGELAFEEGFFKDYVEGVHEEKIQFIEAKVESGDLTREKADEMIEHMNERYSEIDFENPDFSRKEGRMGRKGGMRGKQGFGEREGFGRNQEEVAEIYADLADITAEEAITLSKEQKKSFGELAYDNGFFKEFVDTMHNNRLADIEAKVESGDLTREKADEIIEHMNERYSEIDFESPDFNEKMVRREGPMKRGEKGEGCERSEDGRKPSNGQRPMKGQKGRGIFNQDTEAIESGKDL